MKPIDEDRTSKPDDMSNDVEEEEAEIEVETRSKRRSRSRTRRRRTKLQEYSSIVSMVAWMAFLIVWLFFFASNYVIFENIAVVVISLLIVLALNAVILIPIEEGWKARTSVISGVVWIIFLVVWVFFFAIDYGIFENIGIGIASLLIIGAVNVLLWVPSAGDGREAKISALGGIAWLTFMVLWLPFANDFALVYPINIYQNVAIMLAAFLLMLLLVIGPWGPGITVEIEGEAPGLVSRLKGTIVGLILWLVFIIIWMWFIAGNPSFAFSGYQNIAMVLFSFAVFAAIIVGTWLPWAQRRGEGPESWRAIGLAFLWLIVLAFWFWFFADQFNEYQNFAVFLVSLLIMAAISGSTQWRRYRDFEALDWED